MKTIRSVRLTPSTIAEKYSIPIYQRLFEWDKGKVRQLLDDLWLSFRTTPQAPYYIGMLTGTHNGELVDGQQRFTVMMLMGIAMAEYAPEWKKFVEPEGHGIRLSFTARSEDNHYLSSFCAENKGYENYNMKTALACIRAFLKDKCRDKSIDDVKDFCRYVYTNLSLFISDLPDKYTQRALNRYFETMNSAGKNLENHEILKVRLLRTTSVYDKVKLARMWNAVCDMDRELIRRRESDSADGEESAIESRFKAAFNALKSQDDCVQALFDSQTVNVLSSDNYDSDENYKIGEVEPSSEQPKSRAKARENGYRSILNFSEFLLQVLWMSLPTEVQKDVGVEEFFDVNKLLETFEKYENYYRPDRFIVDLFRYKLLYDRYVIFVQNQDNGYKLRVTDSDKDEYGNKYSDCLRMYQSMLYVNSSSRTYYHWLPNLLMSADKDGTIGCRTAYKLLRSCDEERHPESELSQPTNFSFDKVDRYWFWKLDFVIWQQREKIFHDSEAEMAVAEAYVFRRNRSIEHIAPQNPEDENTLKLPKDVRDSFGNLVMISVSQNSGMSRSTFEIKRAKMIAYIKKELSGTPESLKMLLIYKNQVWNEKTIEDHQKESFKLLESSFQ